MIYTSSTLNHSAINNTIGLQRSDAASFFDAGSENASTISTSLNMSNAITFQNTLDRMQIFSQNGSMDNFRNSNITADELHDFAIQVAIFNKNRSIANETLGCKFYCDGFFIDLFSSYRSMHGYISLAICIFGTIANILNIIVLTRKDMSKTPINTILKWLSVADMFLMIEYIPFSFYMYIFPFPVRYTYSWSLYVLFHMHFTQILHTISISLTVVLALWRYIAIKHPHGRIASCVLSHCSTAIFLSFLMAPILCLPTYFVFGISEEVIFPNQTKLVAYTVNTKDDTLLYSVQFWLLSVIIKLLPCSVLTVISFVLIRVLCQAAKRKVKLKGYNQPAGSSNINTVLNGHRPSKCQRRTDRTTMLLVAVLLLFLITEFPQGILGLLSVVMNKCFFLKCYQRSGEMMDLMALINAAVGFVLYGLMSKQFRTSFKSVFFNQRLSRLEMTRITNLNNTSCV